MFSRPDKDRGFTTRARLQGAGEGARFVLSLRESTYLFTQAEMRETPAQKALSIRVSEITQEPQREDAVQTRPMTSWAAQFFAQRRPPMISIDPMQPKEKYHSGSHDILSTRRSRKLSSFVRRTSSAIMQTASKCRRLPVRRECGYMTTMASSEQPRNRTHTPSVLVYNPPNVEPDARFGGAYVKIGTIQRRLAWPLHKDDTCSQNGFTHG
ncbi:hypothetical protein VP01_2148g1, partial [Puccinia sorghi]